MGPYLGCGLMSSQIKTIFINMSCTQTLLIDFLCPFSSLRNFENTVVFITLFFPFEKYVFKF